MTMKDHIDPVKKINRTGFEGIDFSRSPMIGGGKWTPEGQFVTDVTRAARRYERRVREGMWAEGRDCPTWPSEKSPSVERAELVHELADSGKSKAEIARECGISETMVSRVLRGNGPYGRGGLTLLVLERAARNLCDAFADPEMSEGAIDGRVDHFNRSLARLLSVCEFGQRADS